MMFKLYFTFILFCTTLNAEILFSFGTHKSGIGTFSEPAGIAVYNAEVYVADSNNHRVQVFDKEGNFLRLWQGLSKPTDIAIYAGDVYVADDNQVSVFDTEGHLLRKWGAFLHLTGIAVSNEEVYIADAEKIQVFDPAGNYLRSWKAPNDLKGVSLFEGLVFATSQTNGILTFDRNGTLLKVWGKENEEEGLIWPNKIAIYHDLTYVVDTLYNRIQIYNSAGVFSGSIDTEYAPVGIAIDNGEIFITSQIDQTVVYNLQGSLLRKWGTSKTKNGEFYFPTHAVLSQEELFVLDSGNSRVQVFDQGGNFLRSWAFYGDEDGQLSGPVGMHIDRGEVYIADSGNDRVQVFDKMGNFLRKWGGLNNPKSIAVCKDEVFVTDVEGIHVFDKRGNALRSWSNECESLAVYNRCVYAGNPNKNTIRIFTVEGQFVEEIQQEDLLPASLAFHDGLLFVSNVNCIQIFDPSGIFIKKVENPAFGYCFGLAFSDYFIYIADSTKEQIHVFHTEKN